MFGVVPLICAKKSFITKQMQRGEGEWGGGGGGGGGGLVNGRSMPKLR